MMEEPLRVASNLSRARAYNAPATLTVEQWTVTVADFGGMCAYCQDAPIYVLEHFVPLSRGGGTTVGNCLPACAGCNSSKRSKDGSWVAARFDAARHDTLVTYLRGRSVGPDAIDGAPTAALLRVQNGRMEQIGVRLPPPAVAALDALVENRNQAAGWLEFNRSDLLREAVEKGLAQMHVEAATAKKGGGR